jgi:hypothetical protein
MPKGASQFSANLKKLNEKKKLEKKHLPDFDKLKVAYSDDAKDFISQCLDVRQSSRMKNLDDVKKHTFFAGFDWDGLFAKTSKPPFVPDLSKANCDNSSEEGLDMFAEADEKVLLSAEVLERFRSYDYHTEYNGSGGGPSN